jgi:xanthine/uracil permease
MSVLPGLRATLREALPMSSAWLLAAVCVVLLGLTAAGTAEDVARILTPAVLASVVGAAGLLLLAAVRIADGRREKPAPTQRTEPR